MGRQVRRVLRRGATRRMAGTEMMPFWWHLIIVGGALAFASCCAAATDAATTIAPVDWNLPQFRRVNDATQLFVDDRPFLILGGELGNSTGASLQLMQPIWPRLRALNLNTVLVPVYWE